MSFECDGPAITPISERLYRDRSTVKRDGDEFARASHATVSEKILPDTGRTKEGHAAA